MRTSGQSTPPNSAPIQPPMLIASACGWLRDLATLPGNIARKTKTATTVIATTVRTKIEKISIPDIVRPSNYGVFNKADGKQTPSIARAYAPQSNQINPS